jgi:hypothetical protein
MLIRTIILAGTMLGFANCSNPKTTEAKEQHDVVKKEIINTTPINKDTAKEVKTEVVKIEPPNVKDSVSGHVVFGNSYCGGAYPSDEILKSYEKTYPLSKTTILLKNSNSKSKSYKVTTDEKGNFKAEIPPGTYTYYMTDHINPTINCTFAAWCKVWLEMSFGEVTITQGKWNGYQIIYGFGCNPCEPPRP